MALPLKLTLISLTQSKILAFAHFQQAQRSAQVKHSQKGPRKLSIRSQYALENRQKASKKQLAHLSSRKPLKKIFGSSQKIIQKFRKKSKSFTRYLKGSRKAIKKLSSSSQSAPNNALNKFPRSLQKYLKSWENFRSFLSFFSFSMTSWRLFKSFLGVFWKLLFHF